MIKAYADMLPPLHAERQMLAIEAAASPYMEKRDRKQVIDRYVRAIRRGSEQKRKSITKDELRLALAASGVPIVEVPKKAVKSDVRRPGKGNARA